MDTNAAVLVPLKSFAHAKGRLAGVVSTDERTQLMRDLAVGVLESASGYPRWVVCDDPSVAAFALERGAQVIWRGGGLNPAVQEAVDLLGADGVGRVVISHGDIADPGSFAPFVDVASDVVVIGTDRHEDGTNVISVPTGRGYRFAYGSGSRHRHVAEAERCGLRVVMAEVTLDVDTPEDLTMYRTGDR